MPEIGATLREARMRARIDVSEIEAQTKIRSRYLRALENEEWDLLPGPTFIKSFLRTYATALGLDGKALVEEYRRSYEMPGESEMQPLVTPRRSGRRSEPGEPRRSPGGPSRGYLITVALVAVVIVFLVIGLLTRGTSKPESSGSGTNAEVTTTSKTSRTTARTRTRRHAAVPPSSSKTAQATLSLEATAPVWVCLVGEGEEKLIPGVEMQAGEAQGPFHAKTFEITLGNNSVSMQVNGNAVTVPPSTQAIGYKITSAGEQTLPAESQPTCA